MDDAVHPTLARLLEGARQRTSHLPAAERVTDLSSLKRCLNVSPQVFTNWKTRGVSERTAIAAESTLGVSASWVMLGMRPPQWPSASAVAPVMEPTATYTPSAPLSADVLTALRALPAGELQHVEAIIRSILRMPPGAGLGGSSTAMDQRKLHSA